MLRSLLILMLMTSPAAAFERIIDAALFTNLVRDRELVRFGISMQVAPDGAITGDGLGWDVSGQWAWREGFFCRSLNWGGDDLGDDCQTVLRDGNRLRFVAERGSGQSADFRLR